MTRKTKMSELRSVARALEKVVKVIEFGYIKHPANDWATGFSTADHEDAAFRHLLKRGNDDESGIDHRAHAVIRLLYAMEKDIDSDRTRTSAGVGEKDTGNP